MTADDGLFDPIDRDGIKETVDRLSSGLPHCCGKTMICIESGGCGGNGAIYGCGTCGSASTQSSGGFMSTPGGERFERFEFMDSEDVKRRVAERLNQIGFGQ